MLQIWFESPICYLRLGSAKKNQCNKKPDASDRVKWQHPNPFLGGDPPLSIPTTLLDLTGIVWPWEGKDSVKVSSARAGTSPIKLCWSKAYKQRWKGDRDVSARVGFNGWPKPRRWSCVRLLLELGRNKTAFGEQGCLLEARSLHVRGWVLRNFRTLKRQEKNAKMGNGNLQRGLSSTIEEKQVKRKQTKKNQYQNTAFWSTWYHCPPLNPSCFCLQKSSEQASSSHVSVWRYKRFSPQSYEKPRSASSLRLAACWLPLHPWTTTRENHTSLGASDLVWWCL